VLADSTQVDPATLRVLANFAPYKPVGKPTVVRAAGGPFVDTTWTWQLACLSLLCAPPALLSDTFNQFYFRPALIRVHQLDGNAYAVHRSFPPLETLSVISQQQRVRLQTGHAVWLDQVTPVSHPDYRVSPNLIFWLLVALAALCAVSALTLSGHWVLRMHSPHTAADTELAGSHLERALTLFFWANARGDETLQRKALERVADELPLDVVELSDAARELAWSKESPEGDDVEAISQRAGVPVHPGDGTDE
jgi:hypothetical protein